jgi:hypothetical protein
MPRCTLRRQAGAIALTSPDAGPWHATCSDVSMVRIERIDMTVSDKSSTGDFFSTPMPGILVLVTSLPFLALFVALILIFYGCEFGMPPWSTHSVPPPLIY